MKEIGREKSTYYIYKYIGLYKRKQLKVHGYNVDGGSMLMHAKIE